MSPEGMTVEAVVAALLSMGTAQRLIEGGTPTGLVRGNDVMRDVTQRIGYTEVVDSRTVSDDPFDVMSHEEIWEKANPLSGDNITTTSGNWQGLGQDAALDAGAFALGIANQIGTNWQGPAADAAGQGVARYANSAVELSLAASSLAGKVGATFDGVSATKSQLPPPVPYAGGEKLLDAASWLGRTILPGDIKSLQYMHEEAENTARTVMKTQYAPTIRQAAEQIPVLPQAVDPLSGSDTFTVPTGGWGSGSGGSGSDFSGGGTYQSPSGGAGSPGSEYSDSAAVQGAPQDTATQSASSAPPQTTGTAGAGGSNSAGTPGSGGSNSAGTPGSGAPSATGTPAASSPGAGLVPGAAGNGGSGARSLGSGSPSRFGGGSGGGSGGGNSGVNSTVGRGGSGLGGPPGGSGAGGSSVGGSGAGGSGGVLGGGSTGGRAGAPGMGGMGGMSPAAGRGGGGDDDVHKTPGYLIDAVNGDELIGSLPLVAPPVLGE